MHDIAGLNADAIITEEAQPSGSVADREATCAEQEDVGSNPMGTKSLSPINFVKLGFNATTQQES